MGLRLLSLLSMLNQKILTCCNRPSSINRNFAQANAIVNPNRFDETSNLTYLCAAGVAFLVLSGIVTRFREEDFFKKTNIQSLIFLAI